MLSARVLYVHDFSPFILEVNVKHIGGNPPGLYGAGGSEVFFTNKADSFFFFRLAFLRMLFFVAWLSRAKAMNERCRCLSETICKEVSRGCWT
jgi:predicted acetyltransferase